MLVTISPAKTLDFAHAPKPASPTVPVFIEEAAYLANKLKKLSPGRLKKLMGLSDKLADLNYERFQAWELPLTAKNSAPALFVFQGEVYRGLDAVTLGRPSIEYLNRNLLILSGLYGALRATDLMLPYRLEMGTRFKVTPAKDNLYKFWGDKISRFFNRKLAENNTRILVNLASNEYFKALNPNKLDGEIITPEFKDLKDGNYKVISIFAKKARGLMLRFMAENRINNPEELKAFDSDGYYFNNNLSNEKKWVFTRDH